jgi:restriction system protein
VPKFYWPTLQALPKIGGSGTRQEVIDTVISQMGLTEEQQAVLHKDGPKTKAHYRTEWALSHLKGMGLTTNSSRGVWALTASGREIEENELPDIASRWTARKRAELRAKKAASSEDDDTATSDPDDRDDWRDELKAILLGLSPDAFERLTQRLLREAGFINTRVLGRTGDGGSMAWAPTGYHSLASRSSFSASATPDPWALRPYGTSEVPWLAEATRDSSSPLVLSP